MSSEPSFLQAEQEVQRDCSDNSEADKHPEQRWGFSGPRDPNGPPAGRRDRHQGQHAKRPGDVLGHARRDPRELARVGPKQNANRPSAAPEIGAHQSRPDPEHRNRPPPPILGEHAHCIDRLRREREQQAEHNRHQHRKPGLINDTQHGIDAVAPRAIARPPLLESRSHLSGSIGRHANTAMAAELSSRKWRANPGGLAGKRWNPQSATVQLTGR